MTKADLARAIYNRHGGLSARQATATVDLILNIIKQRLAQGHKVCLGRLGVMEVVDRRSRRGRRPAPGKKPMTRVLVYRPARALR
jgi:nucleoid DNA-binding protein